MTDGIDVDVVIPVRYGVELAREAVESALAQEGASVRVTVVDDASGADLEARLAGLEQVRVVANDRTPGPGGARNAGAMLARAPLLAFLDCDDLWPVDRTRVLAAVLKPGVLALGEVEIFGDVERFRAGTASTPGGLIGTMLMHRADWLRVGDLDESLALGEFVDWRSRARAAGLREAYVNDVVLRRRLHGDQTTVHRRSEAADYLEVVRRHLARRDGSHLGS